jgi:pimeloyl-ACP methyl ester carboxylesterase
MVVGISYGAEFAVMAKLRTADLTPPLSEAGKAALGNFTSFIGEANGGAEAFLAFVAEVLKPEVAKRYPEADTGKSILFGHSLGGLFAAYALLTRPGDFGAFISSSPSLWWDGFAVLGHLEGFADRLYALPTQPRLFLDVGAKEQDLPEEVPVGLTLSLAEVHALVATARMVDGAADFADALRERGLKDFEHHAFAGEDHSTVVAPALMRGLTFALDGWKARAAVPEAEPA